MLMLGLCAGYVDLGVVRESDVRCDDLKIMRSFGSGMKSWCDEAVEFVGSGIITQFRAMMGESDTVFYSAG